MSTSRLIEHQLPAYLGAVSLSLGHHAWRTLGYWVKYSLRHRVIASSERFLTSVTETNLLEFAAVAAREQLKPEMSSGVLLFNISIDDLGGVYLLVLIIQQKDLFIDLFSIGRS